MAEIDFTNINQSSISTPSSGVTAVFVDSTVGSGRLSEKDSTGNIINFVGINTADRVGNKDFPDAFTTISNISPTSKALLFSLGGMAGNITLTLASVQQSTQTLTIPDIQGSDTIMTLGTTQTITGVKTMTNMITAAGTTAVPSMTITSGTNLTSATANTVENDGTSFYITQDITNGRKAWGSWNYFRLTGSGAGISTIADFFGTNDGIPLVAGGIYEIEWHCYFSQATAGTATWTIVSTNALQSLTGEYIGSPISGIGTVGAPQTAAINVTASTSTAFPVTGLEVTGVTHFFTIRVLLQANASTGGNTRLRLTMSAGTATPLINSYFRVRRLPAGNTGTYVA